ncbi:unnamed protein product, partial [Ixodes persulcatus]
MSSSKSLLQRRISSRRRRMSGSVGSPSARSLSASSLRARMMDSLWLGSMARNCTHMQSSHDLTILMVAKIMLRRSLCCFLVHSFTTRSYLRFRLLSTYLSASSIASGLGGGMTKHTPGTRPSVPLALITY